MDSVNDQRVAVNNSGRTDSIWKWRARRLPTGWRICSPVMTTGAAWKGKNLSGERGRRREPVGSPFNIAVRRPVLQVAADADRVIAEQIDVIEPEFEGPGLIDRDVGEAHPTGEIGGCQRLLAIFEPVIVFVRQ